MNQGVGAGTTRLRLFSGAPGRDAGHPPRDQDGATWHDGTRSFLLAAIGSGGTLPPALGLAGELVRRGHSVEVLGDPTAENSARAAGCGFTAWPTAPRMDTIADQTALIQALESGNPLRQVAAARDGFVVGPAQATGLPTAGLMANIHRRPTPGCP